MQIELPFHTKFITVHVPNSATLLQTSYPEPQDTASQIVKKALMSPTNSGTLGQKLKKRRPGDVVVVVSDISRPVPYPQFLGDMLEEIKAAGVDQQEILILIATGMHRPSTQQERGEILGKEIVAHYRIEDHNPEARNLVFLPGKSWADNAVKINRSFAEAGFRLVTGLVEPHFMAGFSGGRKAVCPGLVSLETLQQFHGYTFLAHPGATIANLNDNPCHLEALSIAQAVGVDFSLNVVLNHKREIIHACAGELDAAHRLACEFVSKHANPVVEKEYDLVITSCAGYPLDTTFYQCVKAFVSVLPAVKDGGAIIAVGGCREGIGSESYQNIMFEYSHNFEKFLTDISSTDVVRKDQWEFQMHTRALLKVGAKNIHFFTDALEHDVLSRLSCNGFSTTDVQRAVQDKIDEYAAKGKSICVTPEGPYCSPIKKLKIKD